MARHLFRLAVWSSMFFFGMLLVIRLRSHDDHTLEDFMMLSSDCPAACLMGIRPGVTTRDEALAMLAHHPLIERLDVRTHDAVHWTWNGSQDARFVSHDGTITDGTIRFANNGTVWDVSLRTSIPFGYAWLFLGKPVIRSGPTRVTDAGGVHFVRVLRCTGRGPFYWETPVAIMVTTNPPLRGIDCL